MKRTFKSTPSEGRYGNELAVFIIVFLMLFVTPISNCIAFESSDQNGPELEHQWHKNHAAIFVGGMAPVSKSNETSLALGVAYERRITEMFGLEALADFTIGSHERTALFAAGVTFRPFSGAGLKLMTGPGFEIEDRDNHAAEVNFVYGVGAAWEFHTGPVTLAPAVYADFLGESKTNITFGVGIGTGF